MTLLWACKQAAKSSNSSRNMKVVQGLSECGVQINKSHVEVRVLRFLSLILAL